MRLVVLNWWVMTPKMGFKVCSAGFNFQKKGEKNASRIFAVDTKRQTLWYPCTNSKIKWYNIFTCL